ncbi:MAG: outer membrane protein insertion porin family [Phormidesmis priestleyi Ana]|uniref:Outer membrane protein insertion porin family n=1 Tax=Phormidesmis priestleyi Ana TaxID=1666911 RepID=A0A0N8KMM8_9CYAN|nr:MAG: outer membrane protein insertion porin family [Phormidesmis priestleyi Ana]
MRVSPALLACCSLVAIAGLPGRAAEAAAKLSTPSTADSAVSPASAKNSNSQLALETAANRSRLEPVVEQPEQLLTAEISSQPSLSRLLVGTDRSAPVQFAQEQSDPPVGNPVLLEPPGEEELIDEEPLIEVPVDADGIDLDDADIVEPIEGDMADPDEVEPGDIEIDINEDVLEDSVPAAPNNTLPVPAETPAEIEADETAPTGEAEAETRVLVAEVEVVSSNPQRPLTDELVDAVYRVVGTVPGRTTTRTQLQEDINDIFGTGFFSNVRAEPADTPLGVKVTFFVEPNPVLTSVDVRNRQVLPDEVIDEVFADQYGEILNLRDFQNSVLDLNEWYQENGYVLAQVAPAPQQQSDDGTITLIATEGVVESLEVRYINADGETMDEDGNPIRGKTRDFIITREFETQPGDVFQESVVRDDLGRAVGLGILEDIRLSLDPGDEDPSKVKVIVNIAERDTGSIGASLGFNLRGDLFGQLSYNEDNFGGNNQKLRTEGRVTTRGDFLFDVSFTDPWIAGDPYRTSYTASLFNRRSTSLIFDNAPDDGQDVDLPNGDTPRINRLGGGISFSRPLDNGLSLSLGTQYERIAVVDADGSVEPRDELGNLLTASDNGRDDLFTVQFGAVLDRRNNPVVPTSGSLFRLGTEQSVPLGNGSIFYNKIQGSYSQYVPVNFFGNESGRETIAFNLQGGTILGDLPPYEAFPLGGGNSIRGYEEGEVGAGRSFVLGTVEYRFPLFSEFLNGAIFADYGSDLGSGDAVPGNPGPVRGKPGSGFGYGAGVRVQTPLGALRLDYGLSDEGSRFHFGFGERF